MIVYSDRDVYVGAHVTPAVKDALRREANRRGVSMSAYVADAILDKLRTSGVPLTDESHVIQTEEPHAVQTAA